MTFRCALDRPTPRAEAPARELDAGGDYDTFVIVGCGQLAETDCRFHLGGFGRADWFVDVGYDLAAFLEGLPPVLAGIRSGAGAELDLYPPGLERTLDFAPAGDRVEIRCRSRTKWTPRPDVETIDRAELDAMLTELAVDFAVSLRLIGSALARLAPFADWAAGRV
jgi:hypothetical protein